VNGLIGKKVGMTSIFDDKGNSIACTVIELGPNVVTQVKTTDSDGYNALQLAFGEAKVKNTSKAELGHFAKAGYEGALREVAEFRDMNLTTPKTLGEKVNIEDIFKVGDSVKAVGTSKGKGFQGVVKRHGFGGVGQATHGQHNRLRAPGSIGASSFPSKVFKGMRMAGRMGGDRVSIKGLKVMKIFADQNLILLKGAIPGPKSAFVIVEK
jgi:large subunit ribosomal protein L3